MTQGMRHRRPVVALAAFLAACSSSRTPPPGGDDAGADAGDPRSVTFQLTDVATGLSQPTDFAFLPDGRMVITEKGGAAKLRATDGTLTTAGTFDVDTESEKGLLGVVADPDFATTRRLFFYYSASDGAGGTDDDRHRVVSRELKDDGTIDAAAGTQHTLVSGLHGPQNHDGGGLAIGPDGKLYIGVGDTGCNSNTEPEPIYTPTNFFATCLSNANGKILRVNLDGSVPNDNPLVGMGAVTACGTCGTAISSATAAPRTEIWAWGFRNPWRFWFDPQTGKLWVGDVGEITYEEIDVVVKGRHYGWPWREGPHGWPTSKCQDVSPDTGDCVDPVYHCHHGDAVDGIDGDCISITGGAIVDNTAWPAAVRGRYYFADNGDGRIWSLAVDSTRSTLVAGSRVDVTQTNGTPVSLRIGPDGDLYVADLTLNKILKLAPAP
jgi:glucose/arabinose dehydrogenase